jgi:WD40 repeat protein
MTAQDAFEARVEALLLELSAPAAGPARQEAVATAVAARGAATRRWLRWDGGSRGRLFAIASLAIGSAVIGALLSVGGPTPPAPNAPTDTRSTASPTRAVVQPPRPTPLASRVGPPPPDSRPALMSFIGWDNAIERWDYDLGTWRTLVLYDRIVARAPDFSWFARVDVECDGCPVWVEAVDRSVAPRRAYASTPSLESSPYLWVAASPDGRQMVRAAPGVLEIVDLDGGPATWRSSRPLPMRAIDVPQRQQVNGVAWSPDSLRLAVTLADGDLYVLDVGSGAFERITNLGSFLSGIVYGVMVEWSDDGTRILTTDADFTPYVVTVATREVLHFDVQTYGKGFFFSPDGNKIGYEEGYLTIEDGHVHSFDEAIDWCDSGPYRSPTASRSVSISDGDLTLEVDGASTVLAQDICDATTVKVTWSPDEAWIAVATSDPFARPLERPFSGVTLYPIAGGDPFTLLTNDGDRVIEVIWPR